MNKLEHTVVLSDKTISADHTIIQDAIHKVSNVAVKDLSSIEITDTHSSLTDLKSQFEVYDKFAEGGQGYISRAKDRALKRPVAIKSLKGSLTGRSRRLFSDEALLTAQLDHPSIIPIYSLNSDEKDGLHFSMKLVKGVTLDEYFKETLLRYRVNGLRGVEEKIARRSRLDIFLKICDAMAFAHSKGVIHRDLKPDNVMIGEFNEVYVMDWGIAIFGASSSEGRGVEAENLGLCGTPGYISPALLNGGAPDKQSDIYSLGMILHEAATLEKGYIGDTAEERLTRAKTGDLRDVKHFYSQVSIPKDLSAIIEKSLSVNPEDSYKDVSEFADDIRRYLINEEVLAKPDNILRKIQRKVQQNSTLVVVSICLLLLIMAILNIHGLNRQINLVESAKQRQEILSKGQSLASKQAYKIDSYMTKLENLLADTAIRIESGEEGSSPLGAVIYSSKDFDLVATRPNDTKDSAIFQKEVSVGSPVFKLSPTYTLSSTKGYLNYLYTFTKDFQNIFLRSEISADYRAYSTKSATEIISERALPVKSVYAAFTNGIFISYPGKGGYPVNYDAHERPWYKEAIKHKGLHWGEAYYDVNDLGLVLPCTYTFKNKETGLTGVIALDVTLDFVIEKFMNKKGHDGLLEAAIIDFEGKVIASTGYEDLNKKDAGLIDKTVESELYSDKEVLAAILKGKEQVVKEENGQSFVYQIAEIPSLKWHYLEKKALATF